MCQLVLSHIGPRHMSVEKPSVSRATVASGAEALNPCVSSFSATSNFDSRSFGRLGSHSGIKPVTALIDEKPGLGVGPENRSMYSPFSSSQSSS